MFTLLSGTLFAQVVLIGSSPLLTRLYEPSAFGRYAMLSLVLSLVVIFASGKFEIGVLLPEDKRDAWALTFLAGANSVWVSVMAGGAAAIWIKLAEPADILGCMGDDRYLLLLMAAVMVVLSAWQTALFVWLNRNGRYRAVSSCRVVHAVIMVAVQVALAGRMPGFLALLLGSILGIGASVCILVATALQDVDRIVPSARQLSGLAARYLHLPMHTIPTDLIGTLLAQFPVYFLGAHFSEAVVGYYSLAQRSLQAPMQLIANSVGEVFRRDAAGLYNEQGNCSELFSKTWRTLAVLAVAGAGVVMVAGPFLFALVFGEPWREAGNIARIMVVMFAFKFVVSPVSFMFIIVRKTRLDMILHLVFLAVIAGAFQLFGHDIQSVEQALSLFCALYITMYLVYFGLSRRFAQGRA